MDTTQHQHTGHSGHHNHHSHDHTRHSRRRRREARLSALKMGSGTFFLGLLLLFLYCGMHNYSMWNPFMIAVVLLLAVIGVVVGFVVYFMIRRKQHRSDA